MILLIFVLAMASAGHSLLRYHRCTGAQYCGSMIIATICVATMESYHALCFAAGLLVLNYLALRRLNEMMDP